MAAKPILLRDLQLLWVLDLFLKDSGHRTIYGRWEGDHPLILAGMATVAYEDRATVVTLTDDARAMCRAMIDAGMAFQAKGTEEK